MQVGRQVVDLRRITCPVLNLLATQDTLVPPAQSAPFTELVGSEDTKTIELATRAHRPGDGLRRPARTLAPGRGLAGRAVVRILVGSLRPDITLQRLSPDLRDPASGELAAGAPISSTVLARKIISWIRRSFEPLQS